MLSARIEYFSHNETVIPDGQVKIMIAWIMWISQTGSHPLKLPKKVFKFFFLISNMFIFASLEGGKQVALHRPKKKMSWNKSTFCTVISIVMKISYDIEAEIYMYI